MTKKFDLNFEEKRNGGKRQNGHRNSLEQPNF